MRRMLGRVAGLAAILLLAACGGGGRGTDAASDASAPAGPYVIGPGDTLSVFVYESAPLSVSDLPVRPDGRISVPLVPDLMAAGQTPSELGHEIEDRLKQYVKDPNVTVMVRSFQGPPDRQIRVIGQAVEPQAIPYRQDMTVLDVMIATKGLTKYAAGNRAVLIRREGGAQRTIHVHLSDLIRDGDIRENVAVRPGDTLIIPEAWF